MRDTRGCFRRAGLVHEQYGSVAMLVQQQSSRLRCIRTVAIMRLLGVNARVQRPAPVGNVSLLGAYRGAGTPRRRPAACEQIAQWPERPQRERQRNPWPWVASGALRILHDPDHGKGERNDQIGEDLPSPETLKVWRDNAPVAVITERDRRQRAKQCDDNAKENAWYMWFPVEVCPEC
jgi:hypothetical protein